MSYSDYGGYAYRNGERVEDRSDFTLLPGGGSFGTPGAYPGFAAIAGGASQEDVEKIVSAPHHHAVLGDGPIFVGLHKQSSVLVYRETPEGFESVEIPDEWEDIDDESRREWTVDGVKIEAVRTQEDNYYQYVRVTQPNGVVWHGWSGYGVGAGLEDCGYGFSTDDRESKLWDLWPAVGSR
jgi:hypothetical protein